jgi:hypothetical protein
MISIYCIYTYVIYKYILLHTSLLYYMHVLLYYTPVLLYYIPILLYYIPILLHINNTGKVANGKARYLLNIVINTWWFKSALFRIHILILFY